MEPKDFLETDCGKGGTLCFKVRNEPGRREEGWLGRDWKQRAGNIGWD